MKSALLASLLCFATGATFAQPVDPCATQRNTVEINECGKLTLIQKDKELNAAYQKLLRKLVPSDKSDDTSYEDVKKLLIEAQRNWIRFRDADCKGQLRLHEGGTIRGAVYLGCLAERTEQRTKELLKWADD